MKKLLFILVVALLSCNSKRDIDSDIRNEIADFYDSVDRKNYNPISFSPMDTIEDFKNENGARIITTKLTHRLFSDDYKGVLTQNVDTFQVTIVNGNVLSAMFLGRSYE